MKPGNQSVILVTGQVLIPAGDRFFWEIRGPFFVFGLFSSGEEVFFDSPGSNIFLEVCVR